MGKEFNLPCGVELDYNFHRDFGGGESYCKSRGRYEHKDEFYCKKHHPPSARAKKELAESKKKSKEVYKSKISNANKAHRKQQERYAELGKSLDLESIDWDKYTPSYKLKVEMWVAEIKALERTKKQGE